VQEKDSSPDREADEQRSFFSLRKVHRLIGTGFAQPIPITSSASNPNMIDVPDSDSEKTFL
jgi:hypothetical protein